MIRIKRPFHTCRFAPVLSLICEIWHNTAHANAALTNACDVLTLPATRALSGISIIMKGVVTAAETNWFGRFFVQDSNGGVLVDNHDHQQPVIGDLAEVTGISHPGGHAPDTECFSRNGSKVRGLNMPYF